MRRYQQEGNSSSQNAQAGAVSPQGPSQKMTISFPSHNIGGYEEEDSTAPVTIYLHSPSNKSVKIEIATKISMSDIKNIVDERIGIKRDHQLLYLNGKNVTEYGYVRLQNNNIIHISNTDDLCSRHQQLTLKLTMWSFLEDSKHKITKNYTVQADDMVGEFASQIQRQMYSLMSINNEKAQLYLLESSRILEYEKNFVDQDITNNAQIIGVITANELKTRFSNDTKEAILHDISELLGFEDGPKKEEEEEEEEKEIKLKPVKFVQQKTIRPRFKPKQPKKTFVIEETSNEDDDDPYGLLAGKSLAASVTLPNFKKKSNPITKASSFDDAPRSLVTKLKSSKSKKDLELLLLSQEKQKGIFESPQVVKQIVKEEKEEKEQDEVKEPPPEVQKIQKRRPSPQIPKSMPIKERRQIRLEIEKLFDFGGDDSSSVKSAEAALDTKEESNPISPPTEATRSVEKQKDPLRLSLGSRPLFLDQLRTPLGKKQQ